MILDGTKRLAGRLQEVDNGSKPMSLGQAVRVVTESEVGSGLCLVYYLRRCG